MANKVKKSHYLASSEITSHAKRQENIITENNNQSIETKSELTQTLELAQKDI